MFLQWQHWHTCYICGCLSLLVSPPKIAFTFSNKGKLNIKKRNEHSCGCLEFRFKNFVHQIKACHMQALNWEEISILIECRLCWHQYNDNNMKILSWTYHSSYGVSIQIQNRLQFILCEHQTVIQTGMFMERMLRYEFRYQVNRLFMVNGDLLTGWNWQSQEWQPQIWRMLYCISFSTTLSAGSLEME